MRVRSMPAGPSDQPERFYRDFADGPAYASHAAQDGFANNEELEEFLVAGVCKRRTSVAGRVSRAWPGRKLCAPG